MSFDGWMPLVLILMLDTLSKLNAFDLIVTVALGSTLPTVLLSKDVVLAEGLRALAHVQGAQTETRRHSVPRTDPS
jgi:uncharacterized membrane protein YcaP (DUF421 family)